MPPPSSSLTELIHLSLALFTSVQSGVRTPLPIDYSIAPLPVWPKLIPAVTLTCDPSKGHFRVVRCQNQNGGNRNAVGVVVICDRWVFTTSCPLPATWLPAWRFWSFWFAGFCNLLQIYRQNTVLRSLEVVFPIWTLPVFHCKPPDYALKKKVFSSDYQYHCAVIGIARVYTGGGRGNVLALDLMSVVDSPIFPSLTENGIGKFGTGTVEAKIV